MPWQETNPVNERMRFVVAMQKSDFSMVEACRRFSKKILAILDRNRPSDAWPARSTVDAILNRAGVVIPRAKRRRRQPSSQAARQSSMRRNPTPRRRWTTRAGSGLATACAAIP